MIRPTAEGDVPTESCAGTTSVEGSERSKIEYRRGGGELVVVDEESEETFEEALEDEHNDDVRFVEDI